MKADAYRFFAALLGCIEWLWIIMLILLCVGQWIGVNVDTWDLKQLTWFMMVNTLGLSWVVFHLLRLSFEEAAEMVENDNTVSNLE